MCNSTFQQWQKSVLKSRKKNHILPYKWLFWWVFNFRFLREDVKCKKSSRIIISRSNSYTSYLFFTPEICICLGMILIIWSRGKLNISFSLKFWLQFISISQFEFLSEKFCVCVNSYLPWNYFNVSIFRYSAIYIFRPKIPERIWVFHCRYSICKRPRVIVLALPSNMM